MDAERTFGGLDSAHDVAAERRVLVYGPTLLAVEARIDLVRVHGVDAGRKGLLDGIHCACCFSVFL